MQNFLNIIKRFSVSLKVSILLVTISAAAAAQSAQLSTEKITQYYKNLRFGIPQSFEEIMGDSISVRHRGMWLTAQLIDQRRTMTPLQRKAYAVLLSDYSGYECDTVIGHFHIYYDTSDANNRKPVLYDGQGNIIGTAKEYVDTVGAIFNHVWDVEVTGLGFHQPPFETGETSYVLTISDRGNGDYGLTSPISSSNEDATPSVWTSSIDIDNDFEGSGYSVTGINALKVTAAHEFHHAIQYGYGWWYDSEIYAYELTSTWMESYVYPSIKDNYQYLSNFFSGFKSGRPLYYYDQYYGPGYERFIWVQFLVKRLGLSIIKDIWTHMTSEPFIESLKDAAVQHGSTLSDEYARFAYENYFTADRADTVNSYSNGYEYPRFSPMQSATYSGISSMLSAKMMPLSTTMQNFIVDNDTVTAILANVDVENGLLRSTVSQLITVTFSSSTLYAPYQFLSNGIYAGYTANQTDNWRTFYVHSATHSDLASTNLAASPNPLRLDETNQLVLPVPNEPDAVATVSFISSSLNSMFERQVKTSMEFGKRSIAVPTSLLKSKISSGIYFVIATVNGNEYKWKVAVIK